MSKIRIKSELINKDENTIYECLGIINKNKIYYKENDISVTIDLNKGIILNRKNKSYEIILDFNNLIGSYKLYEINADIPLKIELQKINIEKCKFYIQYKLYNSNQLIGNYKYLLNYEVVL